MAHLFIEYSSNLRGQLDLPVLVRSLHQAALATGIFPIGGLRTRAYATEAYCIADGHPDNAFVHVAVRVGHGRDLATRRRACEQIFGTACTELARLYDRLPLGISVEMQELDPELSFKKNNLHEYVKRRQSAQAQQ
ncbi:MAG TPA: 5-carboxymethyl-2-hydroxymuconate Delta-isomerase [Steroidobacteraceae bacterium]|nr:5-carboxymethyl-2-hydroxymuconate Delta-isomerase [Steroidobacteraceae bacterium]